MAAPRRGPRERIVFSAAQLIRRDGVTGTGMRDVVAHAQAPRGSLQHYFPGGKEQLVAEAVAWGGRYAGARIARFLGEMARPSPSALFAAMARQWIDEFATIGYGAGCPIVAACVDSVESTRTATAAAFRDWCRPVTDALAGMGVPDSRADSLATLMISTLEGAIVMARSEQDVRALDTVVRELGPLLDAAGRP